MFRTPPSILLGAEAPRVLMNPMLAAVLAGRRLMSRSRASTLRD
jgi:hypothetical protein